MKKFIYVFTLLCLAVGLMSNSSCSSDVKSTSDSELQAQKVMINNIKYNKIKDAIETLQISRTTVRIRLNSKLDKWKNWYKLNS